MKYIIMDAGTGLPAAVLFNEVLNHREVAAGRQVLGAGFCNAQGQVWGHSESLGGAKPAAGCHTCQTGHDIHHARSNLNSNR